MSFVFHTSVPAFESAPAVHDETAEREALEALADATATFHDDHTTQVMRVVVLRKTTPPRATQLDESPLQSVIVAADPPPVPVLSRDSERTVLLRVVNPPPAPRGKARVGWVVLAAVLAVASFKVVPLVNAAVDSAFGSSMERTSASSR